MATMNISIPDPLRDWVQSRVETGAYAGVSDYVRELIRKDQEATTDKTRWLGALAASLERGLADADAGRVHEAGEVFANLRGRYAGMTEAPAKR